MSDVPTVGWPMDPVERALMESDQRRSFVTGQVTHDQPERTAPRDVLADDVRRLQMELSELRERHAATKCWAFRMRSALTVARMSIEQRQSIDGRVAANGPSIGEVIEAAIAAEPK